MKSKFAWWSKGALAIAASLAAIVLGEIALRVCKCAYLPLGVAGISGRASFAEDPRGYFTFNTNRDGFRTAQPEPPRRTDEFRLAFLGDSHTFGIGVDDEARFSDLFQTLAISQISRPITTMNLAGPGETISHQIPKVRIAKAFGAATVVSSVYTGNDLGEELFAQPPGTSTPEEAPASKMKRRGRRFYLYHAIGRLLPERARSRTIGTPGCETTGNPEGVGAFQQALWQACVLRDSAQFDESIRLGKRALEGLVAEVRAEDMSLAVVVIPSKLFVEPEFARTRAAQVAASLGMGVNHAAQVDKSAHKRFLELARSLGITTIDIAEGTEPENHESYFPLDWHLNRDGHAMVARTLVKEFDRFDRSPSRQDK